ISSSSTSSSSSRYKTELCRSFTENGLCKYGGKCQFAHGEEEKKHSFCRSSPPLMRQSFSFAGFPSAPQQILQPAFTYQPPVGQVTSTDPLFSGPLGARSLSYTSLSDQDQDGSSSTSSLSGSESCVGSNEGNGKRLAVFSQLSVPEDATGICL
uniref:mRNA decay activator protein ZFP36 n=1 Tax=Monopterus albus TaxID=43700 RepID=A0A3Q3Q2S1_MONAL